MYTNLLLNHAPQGKPEHAVHDMQPACDSINELSRLPPNTQNNMFLTGYTDCAQEALWFLTEVEKLSPDHPTVVGLKQHLYEQYRMYQIQHLLQNVWNMFDNEEESMKEFAKTDYDHESDDSMKADDTESSVTKCAINSDLVPKCLNSDIEHECLHEKDMKGSPINNNKTSADSKEMSIVLHNVQGQGNETELSPEAHVVALALAEEIYTLLQSQNEVNDELDEEEDYSCSTDDEKVDEGFDEMIIY